MIAARVLLGLLVIAIALGPLGLHWAVISPHLARSGQRGMVLLSLSGAVAWYWLWLAALPVGRRVRP